MRNTTWPQPAVGSLWQSRRRTGARHTVRVLKVKTSSVYLDILGPSARDKGRTSLRTSIFFTQYQEVAR